MNARRRLQLLAGGLAIGDAALAVLVDRRSRLVEPLFSPPEGRDAWPFGAVVGWAGLQAAIALRPTAAGARRLALLRAVLVPGDVAVLARSRGTTRASIAVIGLGNAALAACAAMLARSAGRDR